jgi:hypothetical protein
MFSVIDMYNEAFRSISEERSNIKYVDLRSVINRVSASQEVTFNTEKNHSEWVLRLQPEKNRFCADRGE